MERLYCFGIYHFISNRTLIFKKSIKPIIESHTNLKYIDAKSKYESQKPKISTINSWIQKSELCIIDLTYQNLNVFFEYGIAYTNNKKFIAICSNATFSNKKIYNKKFSFDIEDKEVIIYKSENDLRIKLTAALYDIIYKQKTKITHWYSSNPKNNIINTHELTFCGEEGFIKSSETISNNFRIIYTVKILKMPEHSNPDVRLYLSKSNSILNSILIILPWETSDSDNHYECHVDYQENKTITAKRLQQVSVNVKGNMKRKFTVFVSLTPKSLIVESDFFKKEIPRIIVAGKQLSEHGFDTSTSNYLLFSANTKCQITDISISEIE